MNNFKILMACTGLIMCNNITLNSAEIDSEVNKVNINSADIPIHINPFYIENQYAELSKLCNSLQTKMKIIDKLLNTGDRYQYHVEELVDRISKYKKDPYKSSNLSSVKSKISRFQNDYFDKNDIKVLSNEMVYTDVKDILKQISDKFNHIVETINKNSDIPINLDACKALVDSLANDVKTINEKLDEQYKELQQKTNKLLDKISIKKSFLALARQLQQYANAIKNGDKNTPADIINCYKLFMEIYHQ